MFTRKTPANNASGMGESRSRRSMKRTEKSRSRKGWYDYLHFDEFLCFINLFSICFVFFPVEWLGFWCFKRFPSFFSRPTLAALSVLQVLDFNGIWLSSQGYAQIISTNCELLPSRCWSHRYRLSSSQAAYVLLYIAVGRFQNGLESLNFPSREIPWKLLSEHRTGRYDNNWSVDDHPMSFGKMTKLINCYTLLLY